MIRSVLTTSKGLKQAASPFYTSAKYNHTMTRLKGKVAVISASTDGIGLAIAKRLGNEGASVVVSSRKEANVNSAVSSLRKDGINVEGVVCHVANKDQRKKLIETTSEEAWDKIFDINVKCSWLLAKDAYPEMLKRGGGSIVFISSLSGYQPIFPLGPYGVSKTALLGLTKAIAGEVVHDNIRVNCVAPGIIDTKFASALTESESAREQSLSIVPMKRLGRPEEVAGAVAFLVSDDGSFVTGETIVVAGGALAHL
ncbi:dehydrogenase/reductase SDR family member 4 isoform X2 [Ostrinia nubilalis]|uniref:dehydrogenase/reductase SDR family member 4 isoform X2 n=1 Tax=Ostrinia nubilalis TaxID=29057 RepID=UPI00308239BC